MNGSSDRVPDGIEPILGYRMWRYTFKRGRAVLHSLNCPGKWSAGGACPWQRAGRNWVVASCTTYGGRRHSAPVEDCSCGLYAMNTVRDLLVRWSGSEMVLGRVELARKVIEHDYGYRAERARVVELILVEGAEQDVSRLATGWGIPVGDPATLPELPALTIHPDSVRKLLRRIAAKAGPKERDGCLALLASLPPGPGADADSSDPLGGSDLPPAA
jgi:hypothetical protein